MGKEKFMKVCQPFELRFAYCLPTMYSTERNFHCNIVQASSIQMERLCQEVVGRKIAFQIGLIGQN